MLNMFLIVPIRIAANAAQSGPKSTPKIALTMCCVGLAIVPKTGNPVKGDKATPKAENTITTASFLIYTTPVLTSFPSPLQAAH